MSDLNGKVALITGASSGIGAATAKLFASLGAKLSLTGRNEANLKLVVDECKRVGPADAEPPLMVLAEPQSYVLSQMSPNWLMLPSKSLVVWIFWSTLPE